MSTNTLPPHLTTWLLDQLGRGTPPGTLVTWLEREGIRPSLAARVVRDAMTGKRPPLPDAAVPGPVSESTTYWPAAFPFQEQHEAEFEGQRVRVLGRLDAPAVALLDGVLSESECEAIIALAQPRLSRSEVVDPLSGGYRQDTARSSDGTALDTSPSPWLARLQARMAWLTGLPLAHAEGLQVLRYRAGGEYLPHHDYFDLAAPEGGQRCATLVTYLSDVEVGGETIFPLPGLRFSPRRGMAVYFAYGAPGRSLDARSLHAGLPVGQGEKWIATQWMRDRPRLQRSGN